MKSINWGQAFAEVALLFLGVGLALVVDQLRDRAQEREAERTHLMALRSDFAAADSVLQVRLGAIEEQLDHNEALLETLSGPVGSVPGDSIAARLRKAFVDIPVEVTVPAYHDLLNSGEFRLIRSEPLRRALTRFEEDARSATGFSDKAAQQWAGPVTDFFVRELNVTAIYGRDDEVRWTDPGMPTFPPYMNTPHVSRIGVPDEIYWSRELVNRIGVKNVLLDDAASHVRFSLEGIDRIVPLIEAALNGDAGGR